MCFVRHYFIKNVSDTKLPSSSFFFHPFSSRFLPSPLTEKEDQTAGSEVSWDVDQGLIAQLKEQYRKERKGKKGVKSEFLLQLLTSSLSVSQQR